jgi:putative toxin-antitoxin system antitoxin component (TIGR02293 family)
MSTILDVIEQATKILGSREAAENWINSPQLGLERRRPVDLLATAEGEQLVATLLGRIEYGVYT